MYIINDEGLRLMSLYKNKTVAEAIGVHVSTISYIKRHQKPCNKQTAYGITKFINKDGEIDMYFSRKED